MYGRGGGYGRGPFNDGYGGGLSITPMVRHIIIANVVIYLLSLGSPGLVQQLSVDTYPGDFRAWQPFTYMWMHSLDSFAHILFNMLGLFFFGCDLERVWGPRRFLRFYLACGIGAGIIIWLSDLVFSPHVTLGASGAIFGVLLGYSLTWPERTIMLIFPPVAFRAIWLIPILFFMEVYLDRTGTVSHTGHLGGALVGWLILRRGGTTAGLPSWNQIKWRWRRHRMRQKLRAVRWEEDAARQRRHDDRTLH